MSGSINPDMGGSIRAVTDSIESVDEDELYAAMDWLLERQGTIEKRLARRHLSDGALVLYERATD